MGASSALFAFNCTMHSAKCTRTHHSNMRGGSFTLPDRPIEVREGNCNGFCWNDSRNIVELFREVVSHPRDSSALSLFLPEHPMLGSLLHWQWVSARDNYVVECWVPFADLTTNSIGSNGIENENHFLQWFIVLLKQLQTHVVVLKPLNVQAFKRADVRYFCRIPFFEMVIFPNGSALKNYA